MQTRALYAPFESDLRSSSSDVYYHEMPGGQYTNLKFQVSVCSIAAPACNWLRPHRNRSKHYTVIGLAVSVMEHSTSEE